MPFDPDPRDAESGPPPLPSFSRPESPPAPDTSALPPRIAEYGSHRDPTIPPPIPSSAMGVLDAIAREPVFQGRLHPMTLVFSAWNLIRGFIVPAIILLFVGNRTFAGGFLLFFLVIPLAVAVIRYFTFRYRIENGELITSEGLLSRRERNIPLARVQDIRIEQGVLHRVFDMTDVHIETAGGQGAEASLSVLSKAEAERLREMVFAQVTLARAAAGDTVATASAPPEREVIRKLSVRELVMAGLTSNQMASVLALLAVGWSLVDDILPPDAYQRWSMAFERTFERFVQQGIETNWVAILAGVGLLLLIGIIFSVIGSVVMFYGFTLSRSGEDLHRSYGLLTRRASSLPRRRIQLLKIEEKLLRRWFGLATLRADTAGSRPRQGENPGGRDVLLPAVPRGEIEGMLPVFFPDLDTGETEWRRVSRRAIRRGTAKGASVFVILAAVSWGLQPTWPNLWPLALIPVVYALNVMSYRHLGYSLGEKFFRTRRGWLSRATHIVPIRNTQAIVLYQTPLDRRHRVGTLILDTAGQAYTGGAPKIDNVPWDEALNTARALAHRAAQTRYRWKSG